MANSNHDQKVCVRVPCFASLCQRIAFTNTMLSGVGDNPKAPDDRVLNRDKTLIASQIMNEVLHPQEVE
jgi:hypothetical protein